MTDSVRKIAAWTIAAVCAGVMLVAIGSMAAEHQTYALAGGVAVFMLGASLRNPMAIPLLSMATLVVAERVGGEGLNLTLSDAVLFAAFWVALIFTPRPLSRPMRAMLWLSFVYQVASLFTVLGNPYLANAVEWFHAWLLVAGALLVGWAVGRSGHARLGMILMLVPSLLIALQVLVQFTTTLATTGTLAPVFLNWPLPMHKNFVGCVLGFAALVAYVRPVWLRLPFWLATILFWVFAAAIAATQARQALIALGIAIVVICLRRDPDIKRSRLILLPLIPAAIMVSTMVQDQIASGNQFNSAFQRLTWYEQAISVWQINPWYGVGLRWWTAGRTQFYFQPPNAELEVLTSVGIVGLVGFLILMLGGMVVLWRIDPRYGTLAVGVLLSRFVQAQFDLFWVSIQVSMPFAIIGICLGAQAFAAESGQGSPRRVRPGAPHQPSDATTTVESQGAVARP